MEADVKMRLDRIDRKLSLLLGEKKEKETTWVKASIITGLTGWDAQKMRRARINGLLKWRKTEKKGFEYVLESVPEQLLKAKSN